MPTHKVIKFTEDQLFKKPPSGLSAMQRIDYLVQCIDATLVQVGKICKTYDMRKGDPELPETMYKIACKVLGDWDELSHYQARASMEHGK